MKSIRELFNNIHGIVPNAPNNKSNPDHEWYDDLTKPNSVQNDKRPENFIPSFPITNDKGEPDVKAMIQAVAKCLYLIGEKPSIQLLDDIIHKLEDLVKNYRDNINKIPEYRISLVNTPDVSQTVNNLVFSTGEKQVISTNDNIESPIVANTNNTVSATKEKPPEHRVNNPKIDGVNSVQYLLPKTLHSDEIANKMDDLVSKLTQLSI